MAFNVTFNNISLIMVGIIIGGGNQSTWRKPQTCCNSLTNFIIYNVASSTPRHEQGLNSQL